MTTDSNPEYIIDFMPGFFWENVATGMPDDCWPYIGYVVDGRGRFSIKRPDGRRVRAKAHRIAFLLEYGHLPSGQNLIHHKCENTVCCNPKHLEVMARG